MSSVIVLSFGLVFISPGVVCRWTIAGRDSTLGLVGGIGIVPGSAMQPSRYDGPSFPMPGNWEKGLP